MEQDSFLDKEALSMSIHKNLEENSRRGKKGFDKCADEKLLLYRAGT